MHRAFEFFFLDVRGGQRFCAFHAGTATRPRASVLFVHAFADEMNKSRRMAALQARAMADAGYDVLQIDLLGCGDSSGDFGDASWEDWLDDVRTGAHWLLARQPEAPLWMWGMRAGCLLAAEAALRLETPCRFLFWQPPSSGKALLQQFLRQKVIADMMDGKAKGMMDTLTQRLCAGKAVEVGGYTLSAALAQGLEKSTLIPPAKPAAAAFIELSTRANASPSPAVAATAHRWSAAGSHANTRVVNGPSFWQTTEIEDAPALVPATMAALQTEAP